MKFIRFEADNKICYGVVDGQIAKRVSGDIFGVYEVTGDVFNLTDIRLLAPVTPPNIIAIGLNYRKHASETGAAEPPRPVIFLKATTSLLAPGGVIVLPEIAPDEVDYEAELCVVIGREAKGVSEEDALSYVFGYMCGNDVSARDCQTRLDAQWARGKSFDTFCPVGPHIETNIADPDNLNIYSRLNGNIMQSSNTRDMIFSVRQIISYCSRSMTLLPGTLIMTGTPEGVGFARKPPVFLRDGDTIEIGVENIGSLINKVSAHWRAQ